MESDQRQRTDTPPPADLLGQRAPASLERVSGRHLSPLRYHAGWGGDARLLCEPMSLGSRRGRREGSQTRKLKADLMQPRCNSPPPQSHHGTEAHLYFSWPEHRPPLKSSLSKLKDRGPEVSPHRWYEWAPPTCKCRRQDWTQEVRVLDYMSSPFPERKEEALPTCPVP